MYHSINEYLYLQQIGGTYAHPVMAPPAVAIGAVGKIQVNCFIKLCIQTPFTPQALVPYQEIKFNYCHTLHR